jgi:hypothetical protein
MRGIFFREQFDKSPLAPLFQRRESIDWSVPTEIVGMNNLIWENERIQNKVTKSMPSIALRNYFGQQCSRPLFVPPVLIEALLERVRNEVKAMGPEEKRHALGELTL